MIAAKSGKRFTTFRRLLLQILNQELGDRAIRFILVIGIRNDDGDALHFRTLGELDAVECGVGGIGLLLTQDWRCLLVRIVEEERGIVFGEQLDGRILLDPRQHLIAIGNLEFELFGSRATFLGEAKRVTSINGVGDPLAQFFGIQ